MMKNIITIFCLIIAFVTLLTLGTWQVQRLTWKNEIIDQLETVYAVDADKTFYKFNDLKIDNDAMPVLYGSVQGQYLYDKEILVGPRPLDGEIGYYVVTPLKMKNAYVFVHRGFIQIDSKERVSETYINKTIKVSGLFRAPDWNSFTPDNNPANDVWTKLDLEQVAQAKGIEIFAPLMLYSEKTNAPHVLLKTQDARWMPRNKHQQYAIFWFGMAFVLAILIASYIRSLKKIKKV